MADKNTVNICAIVELAVVLAAVALAYHKWAEYIDGRRRVLVMQHTDSQEGYLNGKSARAPSG